MRIYYLAFALNLHSLTSHPYPENIRKSVRTILAEYLTSGIDPEKATLYIRSEVREVTELYLYLTMNAGIGELMRTVSFKDKARKQLHLNQEESDNDVERRFSTKATSIA